MDYVDLSESGNWNVAGDFTKLMIMKPLFDAQEYEKIATFGSTELIESLMNNEQTKAIARINALEWLIHTLITIIDNVTFAIKVRNGDKDKILGFRESLVKFKEIVPKLKYETMNKDGGKKVVIKEEQFLKVLNLVRQIMREIKEPLNRADLIFKNFEEFDPKKMKEAMMDRLASTG